jgi:hypothetical protein
VAGGSIKEEEEECKKCECFSAILFYQKAKNITLFTKTIEKDICAFLRSKKFLHISRKNNLL